MNSPIKRSRPHRETGVTRTTTPNSCYARLLDGLLHNGADGDLLTCVRSCADVHEATGMLVLVCAWGSRECPGLVRELIRTGADVNHRTHKRGLTPLSMATVHGHAVTAGMLIDAGARVDAKDEWGRPPIDLARQSAHEAIVRLFSERFPEFFKGSQVHGTSGD